MYMDSNKAMSSPDQCTRQHCTKDIKFGWAIASVDILPITVTSFQWVILLNMPDT